MEGPGGDVASAATRILAAQSDFDALLLPRNASFEKVRRAYKRLCLFLHPDKNPGNDLAVEAFKAVTSAFESLKKGSPPAHRDSGEHGIRAQPTSNKWSAFTGGGFATAPQADAFVPPVYPPAPQQPTVTSNSKWGRPSTGARQILKVPTVSAPPPRPSEPALSRKKARPAEAVTCSPPGWSSGSGDADSTAGQKETATEERFIDCATFYGGAAGVTKRDGLKSSVGAGTDEVAAARPLGDGGAAEKKSKWGPQKGSGAGDLLRASAAVLGAAAAAVRQEKSGAEGSNKRCQPEERDPNSRAQKQGPASGRRVVVIDDSDSSEEEKEIELDDSSGESSEEENAWKEEQAKGDGGGGNSIKGAAASKESGGILQQLLLKQETDAVKGLRESARAAASMRRRCAAQRTSRRRGGGSKKPTRQTRLKLEPVHSKK